MKINSIDAGIAQALQYYSESIKRWAEVRPVFGEIVEKLDELDVSASFSSGNYLYVNFSGDGKRLAEVVRILRTRGWETNEDPPEANSAEWSAHYKNPGLSDENDELRISINFTSSVCRRIQVGTRTEEVPVYEIRCGDVET